MVAFPLFLHMIILYRDQQRSGNVFMEKIYRGYPLEVKKGYGIFNPERTCSSEGPKKVPWMLYRREEQSGKTELTGNESRSEIDYLRGLYPASRTTRTRSWRRRHAIFWNTLEVPCMTNTRTGNSYTGNFQK